MTDPDETANVTGEITEAWREHLAEQAAKRPVTYFDASTGNIADQMDRYRELSQHDALAGAIAIGKARGNYEPNEHVNDEKFPPLTIAEHLEMLALGERIARYYRHPSQAGNAVRAGASWDQIADATGTTAEAARAAYREWAEGQHKYAGMGDAENAGALKAAQVMTGQHASTDGLEELAGLIHFRVGAWHDFGYENPPTPDCATIPPLGERSANAIRAAHEALKDIDQLIARLHRVKAQLADELRQDEAARVADETPGGAR